MRKSLTQDELVIVLDRWAGQDVAVRVIALGDELMAVFRGRLGARTADKQPALFWPLDLRPRTTAEAEEPGVYLHPHAFRDAAIHVGDTVVEWRQGDVIINVRRQ